jgi:GT2 family glycosyltransferase
MQRVSVLVPCFADAHLVERSLPRLLHGTKSDLEVLLLNNDPGQTEQLQVVVDGLADPRVLLDELGDGASFASAINKGIAATTGDLLLFANSDLFVADGYVDEMVRFFERRPTAGGATGKVLRYDLASDRETNVIDTTGHIIRRSRRVVDRGENEPDIGQYAREEQVFSASGAALVVRRRALDSVRVGGEYLDEGFAMYKEDVDLCWRLRLAGWECWYVPTAVAFHARTSRGLADKDYLAAPRAFHENQRAKAGYVRTNSMKNQWLLLVKNDDMSNLARDLPYVIGREALVLGHGAVFAPRTTASAIRGFIGGLPSALACRRGMKAQRHESATELRRWLV